MISKLSGRPISEVRPTSHPGLRGVLDPIRDSKLGGSSSVKYIYTHQNPYDDGLFLNLFEGLKYSLNIVL